MGRKQKYNIEKLKEFYNLNHRLPIQYNNKEERGLYDWMRREVNKGNKEVIEFKKRKGNVYHYSFSDLIVFYNLNHRLPIQRNKEENGLYNWILREINKDNEKVIEFVKGKRKDIHSDYSFSDLITFYKNNNRLPKSNKKGEMSLYDWMKDEIKKSNKEIIEFVKGKENKHFYSLSELITFYNNNHRLPSARKENNIYRWIRKEIKKGNKKVIEFIKGKENKYYHSLLDLIIFYNNNHRLPDSNKKEEINIYEWVWREIKKGNKELKVFIYLVKNQNNSNNKILLDLYIKQHKG